MKIKELIAKMRSDKNKISKLSLVLSISTIIGWITILSIELARSAKIQDITLNKNIRNLLLLIFCATILNQMIFVSNNIKSLQDKSEAEKLSYNKETAMKTFSLIGNSLFLIFSTLSLISLLDSRIPHMVVVQTVLSFSSALFFILNTSLLLERDTRKLNSLENQDNLNDNQKNDRKYLGWEIANNAVFLTLMLVNVIYNMDEMLEQKLTDNYINTHNIVKIVILTMYIAATISFATLHFLKKDNNVSKDQPSNLNINEIVQSKACPSNSQIFSK